MVHEHESIRSYLDYLEFSYQHPLVAALSMLLLGFAWGKAGTGLGLQNLFWPDRWTRRMIASMSITLYFALIGTLAHYEQWTMIMDSDDAVVHQVDPATIGMPKRGLQAYLLLVGSPMIVLILIPAALPRLFPRLPRAIESASTHHTPDSEGRHIAHHLHLARFGYFLPSLVGVLLGIALVDLLIELSRIVPEVAAILLQADRSLGTHEAGSILSLLSDSYLSHLLGFYTIFAIFFFVVLAWLGYRHVTAAMAVCVCLAWPP